MTPAPIRFGKWNTGNRRGPHAKLTRDQVEDMRRWARGPGFGLPLGRQAALLMAGTDLHRQTVEEVLMNRSWFDPTYRRDEPLPTSGAALPLGCLSWILMLWWLVTAKPEAAIS